MLMQADIGKPYSAHVIVLGNEKGGSGKSTTAMHVAVALMKAGQRVATIDLNSRQKSFTHYIEHRRDWAERAAHQAGNSRALLRRARLRAAARRDTRQQEFSGFAEAVSAVEQTHDFVVIDTPGTDSYLMRLAHSMADTLITPLNDSFVDFDVLGSIDPTTFAVDRRQPLRRDGARSAPPAPHGRRRPHRLDRGAQPALDARLAQQAAGRRGARRTRQAARLPRRRRVCRTCDLPRVFSARPHRARRTQREHARHAAAACPT